MRRGYWATHNYKRHSVDRDVEEFAGWSILLEMVNKARARDGAFVATAFETGGRVTEVRMLHKDNFILTDPNFILVTKMRILKRFHRETDPNTGKKKVVSETVFRRRFPIKRDEPLAKVMLGWIEKTDEYLFPSHRGNEPYLGRTMCYKIARRVGDSVGLWIYPHWFRAQRASQLHFEYGFDTVDLMDWFGWKDTASATRYAKMGWRGLAKKMGVKE